MFNLDLCSTWYTPFVRHIALVLSSVVFSVAALLSNSHGLQELRKQNPQLMQQISQHQQEFMRMVMEAPEEGEDEEMAQMAQLLGAMGGGGGAGGLPPGVVQVSMWTLCLR